MKHGSDLQSTISLNSGESENYALVKKASAIGMSARARLEDSGEKYDLAGYRFLSSQRNCEHKRTWKVSTCLN